MPAVLRLLRGAIIVFMAPDPVAEYCKLYRRAQGQFAFSTDPTSGILRYQQIYPKRLDDKSDINTTFLDISKFNVENRINFRKTPGAYI